MHEEFVEGLSVWIRDCGMTLVKLSALTGVSVKSLAKWRDKKRGIRPKHMDVLKDLMARYPLKEKVPEKDTGIVSLLEKRREYLAFNEELFAMKLGIPVDEYRTWLRDGVPENLAEGLYDRWELRKFEDRRGADRNGNNR